MSTADRAGALDLRILGPVEVEADGRVWSPGGRRQRRLLALLLLNANESIPVDRLVDVLWDEPPRSARQQIHNATNHLRSVLSSSSGGVRLAFAHGGYRLDASTERIDLFRFRAAVREAALIEAGNHDERITILRRALDQWRGPALAGLGGLHLASVAAGLDEERLAATELLVAARLHRGEAGALVGELIALVAEHPLRESLRASLMTALHREGRQADALAVYEEGRRQLADELGLDPGPQLRAAHERVLLGDSDTGASNGGAESAALLATRAGTEDERTEASPAHCYLPGDTAEFSGREAEIRQLMHGARRRTATASVISSIGGMGGVGKTALAIHVAHKLAAQYPDGQYFVDLQGFSTVVAPLTSQQALQILLRECATPPERIPADLAGRSALWRAQIAGRRAILLIDNALDAAQVRTLLPGTSDMLVLITSRRRLSALEGAIPLSLDVLPQQDAIDMFVQIVGGQRVAAEPEAVQAAVDLCGRLPLAIRIAAARLRDRASWTVADLVEKLRDQRYRTRMLATGDRDVMAVLAVSYRYLNPDQRRVFRLLSLHPGADFTADAVAAMTGMPVVDAEDHLDALFEDNLLFQPSVGRYHFHDLVRDCSRILVQQHETAADQQSAILRLLDHYLAVAHALCTDLAIGPFRFAPNAGGIAQVEALSRPPDRSQALLTLEAEHRNLTAAARFAWQVGSHAHAWQIACTLQPYFGHVNYTGDALELLESAVDAARSVGDLHGEMVSLTALGLACRAQRSSTEARALLTEALAVCRQCGDAAAEQFVLTVLGTTELNSSMHLEARAHYLEAYTLAKRYGDRQVRTVLANNLGVVSRDLGDLSAALRYFEQARHADLGEPESESRALLLNNLAHIRYLQGNFEPAVIGFHESLEMSRAVSSRLGEVWCLIGLCSTFRSLGEYSAALDAGRGALDVARRDEFHDAECDALNVIGDVLLSMRSPGRAQEAFTAAIDLARKKSLIRGGARSHDGMAHVHLFEGQDAEAHRLWRIAAAEYSPLEADNVSKHLGAADLAGTTCRRCETDPPHSD